MTYVCIYFKTHPVSAKRLGGTSCPMQFLQFPRQDRKFSPGAMHISSQIGSIQRFLAGVIGGIGFVVNHRVQIALTRGENTMPPVIGISFISLVSAVFIAYILFLWQQQRLQDEIARRCRHQESGKGHI